MARSATAAAVKAAQRGKNGGHAEHAARLVALRSELARRSLAGFVVPLADEHQGEYHPAPCPPPRLADRLHRLGGDRDRAGPQGGPVRRRALHAAGGRGGRRGALRGPPYHRIPRPTTGSPRPCRRAAKLGYDPVAPHAGRRRATGRRLRAGGCDAGACGRPTHSTPSGTTSRPPPLAPAVPHPVRYAGRAAAAKRREIGAALKQDGHDAAFLSAPDSIAWLLNIRGGDVPHTPVRSPSPSSMPTGGSSCSSTRARQRAAWTRHLGSSVAMRPPDALGAALDALGKGGAPGADRPRHRARVGRRPAAACGRRGGAGGRSLHPAQGVQEPPSSSTARAPRICRDGAALCRFLAWLATEAPKGGAD